MQNNPDKGEIILYKPDNFLKLEVRLEDESVLPLLSKRAKGVDAAIYTAQISPQFQLDLQKHNAQYPPVSVKIFTRSHDRFLFIDDAVYHIGASLKDLGRKWFAFSKMESDAETLLKNIN